MEITSFKNRDNWYFQSIHGEGLSVQIDSSMYQDPKNNVNYMITLEPLLSYKTCVKIEILSVIPILVGP